MVLNWPAVATKVALVAPVGTVTAAGSVKFGELDVNVTVAPLVALIVTVHVLVPPAIKVAGEHEILLMVAVGAVALTVPPVPVNGMAVPSGAAPSPLIMPIAALLLPDRVAVTVAAIPLAIVFAFMPDAIQVYAPELLAQVIALPAEARTGPVDTLRPEIVLG